mmetsp:Transcript_49029/g.163659  ORF Transcript_49029/g.163659 Transcript_49029/m.163659 type:complete len:327 (+) Transcript_49029:37-1017(+)
MVEEQRAGANAYLWEDAAGASLAHAVPAPPTSSAPTLATAGCSPCSSSHASWMGSQGMGSQGSASAGSHGPRAPAAYPLSYASADLTAVGDGGSGRLNARRWPVESPPPVACGGAPLGTHSLGQVQELLAEQQSKNIELMAQLYEARQHTPADSGWPPSATPHTPPPPPVPPVLPLQPAQGAPLPGPLPAPLSALPYPYGIGAAGWEAEAARAVSAAEGAEAGGGGGARAPLCSRPPPRLRSRRATPTLRMPLTPLSSACRGRAAATHSTAMRTASGRTGGRSLHARRRRRSSASSGTRRSRPRAAGSRPAGRGCGCRPTALGSLR